MPAQVITALVTNILQKLHACEIPRLTAATHRMLDGFFQNTLYDYSAETTSTILAALLKARVGSVDMEALTFYSSALASGSTCLHKKIMQQLTAGMTPISSPLGVTVHFPKILLSSITELVSMANSEFRQVQVGVGASLKRMICTVFNHQLLDKYNTTATAAAPSPSKETVFLNSLMSAMEPLLQLKNQPSWLHILDSYRNLFDICRGHT